MAFSDENKHWTDADGYAVEIYSEESAVKIRTIAPDGRKSEGSTMARNGEFVSTIESVIPPAYVTAIRKLGKDPRDFRRIGSTLFRVGAEPFVSGVLAELRATLEKQRAAAKENLNRNVPGLAELRAACDDSARYSSEFSRMMSDENNDGARPPVPVATRLEDVAARYPIAAAYLQAETWENAAHYAKSAAGSKAKARIAAGEDWQAAIAEMESDWSAHCNAHVWD